jgi:foldase protein PrsA
LEDRLNRFVPAVAAFCFVTSSFAQNDPAAVVLTVNGETVKSAEYYRRMEFLPGTSRRQGNTSLVYPPGFLTLEALITEKLIYQLAKQKGVLPSAAEVQAELNALLTENPSMLNEAALAGQTKADVEAQLRLQMTQFKLSTFGITVTDVEVDNFYKNNPTLFTIPKRAKLSVIAVSDEASKGKIDAELGAGKPFAEVAKTYSEDITKANGGEYGTVPIAGLAEPVRNAINATKIGGTTAWVAMPNSTLQAKFLLQDVLPESKTALDAKLRKQIRRELMLQRGKVKNDIPKEMAEMRAKAKIDIANKAFAEMYKKFVDEYLKDSGTPGVGSGGGGGAGG